MHRIKSFIGRVLCFMEIHDIIIGVDYVCCSRCGINYDEERWY